MQKDLILSIDNGTQSVRALVFDLQGNLLAKSRAPMPAYQSPQPGWAEAAPEVFWEKVVQACQQLWAQEGGAALRQRLAGLAITTIRGTMINLDQEGRPLRPAMMWMDQRRAMGLKPLGGLWGLAFRLSGMTETVAYLQAEAEANWIAAYQPEIWAKTHKYLFISGYLNYRMTGRLADSSAAQVGYLPFDYKARTWSKPWDWKWQAIPVRKEHLIDLVPPAHPLGEVTRQAAEETGIPAGLPVIAAAADKACEVIGCGGLRPNIACLSFGSAATVATTHPRYIEPIPLIPPYPSAIPDAYHLEVQVYRGFWMVTWFKEQFGHVEVTQAAEREIAPEALFDEMIAGVPPGSMGLMLQPYWTPGLKVPGPEAKGAMIGFGDVHTRAHVYRAILEGLAFALRDGMEMLVRRSKVPVTELRISGGGSQSAAAMQIAADVFGLPAARPHLYETSGLGAAIDAAVGLHLHPDFSRAVTAMTRIGEVFEPNPDQHNLYNALYQDVYLKMYPRLRPLYERIREITGYPPRLGK
jgi:sugar (pentulose or hexulose) kinase